MARARRHARAGPGDHQHGGQGRALLRAPWVMRASRPATPTAGSAPSRRSRSAPTPRAGSRRSRGILKPGDVPITGGLYLMDMIPDGEVRWGFPNINDNAEVAEMIACGSAPGACSRPGAVRWWARRSRRSSRSAPIPRPTSAWPTTWTWTPAASSKAAPRSTRSAKRSTTCILRRRQRRADQVRRPGPPGVLLLYKSFEPLGPACFPSAA